MIPFWQLVKYAFPSGQGINNCFSSNSCTLKLFSPSLLLLLVKTRRQPGPRQEGNTALSLFVSSVWHS